MSVKDSYTDFHVDFGGTSVWYHILRVHVNVIHCIIHIICIRHMYVCVYVLYLNDNMYICIQCMFTCTVCTSYMYIHFHIHVYVLFIMCMCLWIG